MTHGASPRKKARWHVERRTEAYTIAAGVARSAFAEGRICVMVPACTVVWWSDERAGLERNGDRPLAQLRTLWRGARRRARRLRAAHRRNRDRRTPTLGCRRAQPAAGARVVQPRLLGVLQRAVELAGPRALRRAAAASVRLQRPDRTDCAFDRQPLAARPTLFLDHGAGPAGVHPAGAAARPGLAAVLDVLDFARAHLRLRSLRPRCARLPPDLARPRTRRARGPRLPRAGHPDRPLARRELRLRRQSGARAQPAADGSGARPLAGTRADHRGAGAVRLCACARALARGCGAARGRTRRSGRR